jgi:hypothetical protein
MSDKDINYSPSGSAVDHYETTNGQERRRSSIADLNRNKNLDAKYDIALPSDSKAYLDTESRILWQTSRKRSCSLM